MLKEATREATWTAFTHLQAHERLSSSDTVINLVIRVRWGSSGAVLGVCVCLSPVLPILARPLSGCKRLLRDFRFARREHCSSVTRDTMTVKPELPLGKDHHMPDGRYSNPWPTWQVLGLSAQCSSVVVVLTELAIPQACNAGARAPRRAEVAVGKQRQDSRPLGEQCAPDASGLGCCLPRTQT